MPEKTLPEATLATLKSLPESAKTVKKKMLKSVARPEVSAVLSVHPKETVQSTFTQEYGTISMESQKRKVKIFSWRGESMLSPEELDQQLSCRKTALQRLDENSWAAATTRLQSVENTSLPVYSNTIIEVLKKKPEPSELATSPISYLERFKRGVCMVVHQNRLKKRVRIVKQEKLHPKPVEPTSRLIKTNFKPTEPPTAAFQQFLADLTADSWANEPPTIETDSCNRLISVKVVPGPVEITDDLLPLECVPCDFLSIHQYDELMEFNPREIFLASGPPHTSRFGYTVEGHGVHEFSAAEPANSDRRNSLLG